MSSQLEQLGPAHPEPARLAALDDYGLREGGGWPELEALLRLATRLTGLPFASLNVLDAEHQLQPVSVGFVGTTTSRADSTRS